MKIEQGLLNFHNLRPVGQGITGAFYATVYISGTSYRCVVKSAGDREIAAECLCALLGNALGLPTLAPVIVTDPRDKKLLFGTRDVNYPSLSSRLQVNPQDPPEQIKIAMQELARILSTWSQVGHIISFDELIENGDRNPGNILWNGTDFSIIDHEQALGIQQKNLNKLALFAIDQFDPTSVATVASASTSAALAQQAMLGSNSSVWQMITNNFASTPPVIQQHCSTFSAFAQANLGSLTIKTADLMSPLLRPQQ